MIKAINQMKNRLMNSVARALVSALNDSGDIQLVNLSVLADETLEDVERVQDFGFSSNAPVGSQAVIIMVGANRDHPLCISANTPASRKKLASGETSVYSDAAANYLYFKANGKAELKTSELSMLVPKIVIGGPLELDLTKFTVKNAAGDDLIDLLVQIVTAITVATTTTPGNAIGTGTLASLLLPKLTAFKV